MDRKTRFNELKGETIKRLSYLMDMGIDFLPRPQNGRESVSTKCDSPAPSGVKMTESHLPSTGRVIEPINADTPGTAPSSRAGRASGSLKAIREELGECTRCRLSADRNRIVFGVGNPDADIVFVGEGPGRDEDLKGEPFVGRAGQLLTKIIEAMGLTRDDVYICNVVKCRPPNNRNPEPAEIAACRPFLEKQLDAIEPRFIVALGGHAAHTLLNTETRISELRGHFHHYRANIRVMPTFHPAYLLRYASKKKETWEDMQQIMKELNLPGKSGK
ncbi:MAG: uracil-DNA glycosylase [Thermodesulfobacteriota bacterium]